MTTEYYRAMLNGELGFELVADFNSFPRLGSFVFNDQEMPQTLRRTANTQGTAPGITVPYPTAEEAFSVYDHPRVLIFKKNVRLLSLDGRANTGQIRSDAHHQANPATGGEFAAWNADG